MSRQLSKGTLGLKFMNRIQPTTPGSPASPAAATPASAPSTPTVKPASKSATPQPFVLKDDIAAQTTAGEEDYRPVASSSRSIIQESSLLSFPMLSSYDSAPSTSTSSHSALSAYSSMPLSSFTVSGRRSFGGANADIEKLNNPNANPDGPEEVARGKESASQRKKRKAAERENATVTGRRLNVNTPRTGAAGARAEELEGSAGKKQKTGVNGGGFAKPGGFEGARTTAGGAKGKAKAAASADDLADEFDPDASFDEAMLDSSESSADEDASDEDVEAFLKSAVAPSAKSKAVANAEAGFVEDEAPAASTAGGKEGEAGLSKNQKRKLALKRAKEEAERRKGKKGGP